MPFVISDFLLLNDLYRVSKKDPFDGLNHDASLLGLGGCWHLPSFVCNFSGEMISHLLVKGSWRS